MEELMTIIVQWNVLELLNKLMANALQFNKDVNFVLKYLCPPVDQDGITYRNLCEMKCNNAQFEGFGVCEKKKDNRRNCSQCPNV
jgi:hypothetical protein